MTLEFNATWVTAVLLCSLRLSALLLLAPFLQVSGLPIQIRALLIMLLATSLVVSIRLAPYMIPTDLPQLFAAGFNELAIGALMSLGIFVAFAAFSFAGNLLDLQMGFSIANVLDPITRSQSPLIAALFGLVAAALFFTMDAHHTLLRGIAYSLERMPIGTAMLWPTPADLMRQFGSVFTLGLMLAAPPLFCLFMVEVCLAVLSRNLPQMNIFTLSVPVKIAIGLSVMAYVSAHFGAVATKVFGGVFTFWERVL
ncbi:MAG: flagellar biosynthetic protein FliR [Pseudomonadota bacterium]